MTARQGVIAAKILKKLIIFAAGPWSGKSKSARCRGRNDDMDNKELEIIPGAVHVDLYDRKDIIPFDKIELFFKKNL